MVAIGRVVLTSREHVMAMVPRGKGLMGTLLRYPYEVRDDSESFDDIPDVKLTKDMMDLARHIVETKSGHFKPRAIRGSLRARAQGADREEGQGREDRSPEGAADRQGHQSHGRTAPLGAGGEAEHAGRRSGKKGRKGASRAKGNAAADFRKEGRARPKTGKRAAPAPGTARRANRRLAPPASLPADPIRRSAAR